MRGIRKQINEFTGSISNKEMRDSMIKMGKLIIDSMNSIENTLVQNKAKNGQDLLNYPMKLNNKMAALIDQVDAFKGEVPQQYFDVYNDLAMKIDAQLFRFEKLKNEAIADFNKKAKLIEIDVIKLK